MAAITVVTPSAAGAAIAFVAASGGGDTATWYNDLCLHVKNADASDKTVTIDCPGTCSFGLAANAAHDLAVTVAAGTEKIIFLGDEKFKQSNGTVSITYSAVTSVTVGAFRG